jgi:hypothetical protein
LNAEFTRVFQDMFDPAQAVRFQGNFRTAIESSRESFDKATEYAKENMKTVEHVVAAAQASSNQIGDRFLRDAEASAKSFFDTAAAMTRAKTISEITALQAEFVHKQVAVAAEQSRSLLEFSSKITQRMFEAVGAKS